MLILASSKRMETTAVQVVTPKDLRLDREKRRHVRPALRWLMASTLLQILHTLEARLLTLCSTYFHQPLQFLGVSLAQPMFKTPYQTAEL